MVCPNSHCIMKYSSIGQVMNFEYKQLPILLFLPVVPAIFSPPSYEFIISMDPPLHSTSTLTLLFAGDCLLGIYVPFCWVFWVQFYLYWCNALVILPLIPCHTLCLSYLALFWVVLMTQRPFCVINTALIIPFLSPLSRSAYKFNVCTIKSKPEQHDGLYFFFCIYYDLNSNCHVLRIETICIPLWLLIGKNAEYK